jgi:hypothetical protein
MVIDNEGHRMTAAQREQRAALFAAQGFAGRLVAILDNRGTGI